MRHCSTICLWLVLTSAALFLHSCEPHPEYNTTERGLQWRLVSFTEKTQYLDSAAQYYVEYVMLNSKTSDTLAYEYDFQLEKGQDALRNFLQTRHVGDSLEILTSLPDVFNAQIAYWDTVRYHIRIDRMRTSAQLESRRLKELNTLDSLIRIDSVSQAFREMNDIYFRSLEIGDTTKVREGKEIVIHYQGRTLDGEVFDDSRRMVAPLRFVYGNEDQVLKGIDIALSEMYLNGKSEIIVPSWLAFGSTGSADGRVLPYTPVIYQIEVLEVSKE